MPLEEEVRDLTPAEHRHIQHALRRVLVEPVRSASLMIRWMKNVSEDLLILSSRIAELEQAAPAPAKNSRKKATLPPEEELAPVVTEENTESPEA